MNALAAMMDTDIDRLRAAMPTLAEVARYAGQMDAAESGRVIVKAPAVYLAIANIKADKPLGDGRARIKVRMAAFVLARDLSSRDTRAMNALDVVEAVTAALLGLGNECSSASDFIGAENLYSGKADERGLALWRIDYSRMAILGAPYAWPEFLPEDVFVGYVPRVGIPHEPDYEQVASAPGVTP